MRHLISALWRDDGGNLLSTEFLVMASILLLGVIAGLVLVRDAVVVQMEEFGMALDCLPIISPDDAEDELESTGSLNVPCAPGPDSCSLIFGVPVAGCGLTVSGCP